MRGILGSFFVVLLSILSAVYCLDEVCKTLPELSIVPNREDCRKFYRCVQGSLRELMCAEGLEFSEIDQACEDPKMSVCHALEGHVDRTQTLRRLCRFYGNSYLLPNVDDCTKFYECAYEEPKEFACPEGLVYNDPKKTCDYPERTICTTSLPLRFPDVQPFDTN